MIPKNYELIRDTINASATPTELAEAISFGMSNSQWLNDIQQGALRSLVEQKQKSLQLTTTYDTIDAENFKSIEIEVSNTPIVHATPDTPKRMRKPKESTPEVSYKVSRRVNKPIDWVQYSNNEYIVEVMATDKEILLAELDAVEAEVIQRLSLYNKDALEVYGKKKFDEWYKAGLSESPNAVAASKVNTFEYDMSQTSALDLQYTLARYQRLNSFVLQSFEKFPEVKAFYTEFDKANPKVPQPNL